MTKLHILLIYLTIISISCKAYAQDKNLRLVFIRHAERPDDGDNLTCKGLNRSILLPPVLYKKFGKPSNIYVPAMKGGKETKRIRMLQTILPFAVKYNLNINSTFAEEDDQGIATALLNEKGTVIIVWEHNTIQPILKDLGVKNSKLMIWPESDFDTIYIVNFINGKAVLTNDKENLNPPSGCPF